MAFKLTAKHQKKKNAYGIEEGFGHTGAMLQLVADRGWGAYPFSFLLQTLTQTFFEGEHFIFNTSMKKMIPLPVMNYIKVDMAHHDEIQLNF